MRFLFALFGIALQSTAVGAEPPIFAAFDAASEAVLGNPHDLELGPDGRLYVADVDKHRIAVLDPSTLALVGEVGIGTLSGPHDVTFDPAGQMLVADTNNGRIAIFAADGTDWTLSSTLEAGLYRPEGVAAHPNGTVIATSAGTGAIIAFRDGEEVASASGLSFPHDVAIAKDGTVWVADTGNRRLIQYSADLKELSVVDDAALGFSGPRYLDIDAAGLLIVADKEAHRIKRIGADGSFLGVLGDEAGLGPNLFRTPEGVEIVDGRYYFSDSGNDRVVRYLVVTN